MKKKESLNAIKLKEIFTMVWKVQNVQGFVWKTTQPGLGGKSCWHTNPSHFWQPLQSLLWDIRLKICRLTNYCNMLFQVLLTKFSKREPFLLITWSSIARQSQPWVSSINGALITTEYMTFQVFRFLCIVLHVSASLNRSLPDPDIPLVLHKSSQIHDSMVFHVY